MVGGFLRVLRLLPPLKLVTIIIAEILLKVALNTTNKFKSKYIISAITSKTTRQFDKAELPEYPEKTTDHGQATGKLLSLAAASRVHLFVIYKAKREPTPYC
jgi:hypothetical protein